MGKRIYDSIQIIVVVFMVAGIAQIILSASGCDSFQRKTYTEEGTKERNYEICVKAQTVESTAGGNVEHCKEIQDDFTTAGKHKNFKTCYEYYALHGNDLKELYPDYNCFNTVYGEKEK